jgi:hypothetical protein
MNPNNLPQYKITQTPIQGGIDQCNQSIIPYLLSTKSQNRFSTTIARPTNDATTATTNSK